MHTALFFINLRAGPVLLPGFAGGIPGFLWGRIMACNRPMIATGIVFLLIAAAFKRIPRLSKEDWIQNSRRTIFGIGILLIFLSFTAGSGSGFGIGSGDGVGIGNENSSGQGENSRPEDQTEEKEEASGEKDSESGQEEEIPDGGDKRGEEEDFHPLTLTEGDMVIRVHAREIYLQENPCSLEELEQVIRDGYQDGMAFRVQDDYADDIVYAKVLALLDRNGCSYGKETLE